MLPTLLVILCVVLRVLPHPPNLAPVGAAAVFAGRTLKPWTAPVAARRESRPLWEPVPTSELAVV
jgi:hypothetical protein